MTRLAIVTTHPIQYNAPFFRMLSSRKKINIMVFYTWGDQVLKNKFDPGFGKMIQWDVPLLDGYNYRFVKNDSKFPGSHHFKGIDNPTLIKEIKQWHADAILVFGWGFKSHLRCLRYFHGKLPVFFRGDSTDKSTRGISSILRTGFLKWVYRHVDKAFYVGTENKKYFQRHGLAEGQLIFAPHAVNNELFFDCTGFIQSEAMEWRKKLGIGENELVILYAGKLEPIKNLEWLVNTVKNIKDVPVKMVIVGNGPLEKTLKKKAENDPRFVFLDFQNQSKMPVIYRLADVFTLCSFSETWGLSINEAMASGRPILVSDTVAAAGNLVENGVNGYIYQSGDIEDFQKKIRKFAEEKDVLEKMGERSMNIIKVWSFEKICEAIEFEMNLLHQKLI